MKRKLSSDEREAINRVQMAMENLSSTPSAKRLVLFDEAKSQTENWGREIARARKKAGFTYDQLAKATRLSPKNIVDIEEANNPKVPPESLWVLCRELGLSLSLTRIE